MGEYARTILRRIRDVIDGRAAIRIHRQKVAHSFRNLVVGARCITAYSQTADDVSVFIQRHASAEKDQPAHDLTESSALTRGWSKGRRIKQIGLTKAPERMSWLCERV